MCIDKLLNISKEWYIIEINIYFRGIPYMEIENDGGVDGDAVALISKIRYLSVYSIIYSIILIPILLFFNGNYPEIAWSICGIIFLGSGWTYFFPSKANLLILGIVHSLAVPYGVLYGTYVFCTSIIFAVIYFVRFSDIHKTPITPEDLNHIKVLKKQFKPQKPGDVIRITVITLVDRRMWKCIFREDQLLIHSHYRDEMHVGRREDVRILGSNINKPRINIRFTLRMNGDIYRCRTNVLAYHRLARWIEDSHWEMAR
jgi:hypothetical protein